MSQLFKKDELYDFNENISNWNVSNVTTMEKMFSLSKAFNQPIDKWDVSKVTNMSGMFMQLDAFNQPIDKWDVSKVTDMHRMFYSAESFQQTLPDEWKKKEILLELMGADTAYCYQGSLNINIPPTSQDTIRKSV